MFIIIILSINFKSIYKIDYGHIKKQKICKNLKYYNNCNIKNSFLSGILKI